MSEKGSASSQLGWVVAAGCAAGLSYYLYKDFVKDLSDEREGAHVPAPRHIVKKSGAIRRSLTVKKPYTTEICLSDVQSLRNAIAGGCNSVELCVNRNEGGKRPFFCVC